MLIEKKNNKHHRITFATLSAKVWFNLQLGSDHINDKQIIVLERYCKTNVSHFFSTPSIEKCRNLI